MFILNVKTAAFPLAYQNSKCFSNKHAFRDNLNDLKLSVGCELEDLLDDILELEVMC